MPARRSYRGLSALPAWLLLDRDGKTVASVRADTAEAARLLFRTGLPLDDVRRGFRIAKRPITTLADLRAYDEAGPRLVDWEDTGDPAKFPPPPKPPRWRRG